MKSLILCMTLLSLVSCGKSSSSGLVNGNGGTNTGPTVTTNGGVDSSNVSIALTAIKNYSPINTQDGVYSLSEGYNVAIPSSIDVINGNAGNWTAEIHFDNLVCYYKGGSSMTNPIYTGNTLEISKGKKYNFTHCSLGNANNSGHSVGNAVFVMNYVGLTIKNGDSQSQTKVAINLLLTK